MVRNNCTFVKLVLTVVLSALLACQPPTKENQTEEAQKDGEKKRDDKGKSKGTGESKEKGEQQKKGERISYEQLLKFVSETPLVGETTEAVQKSVSDRFPVLELMKRAIVLPPTQFADKETKLQFREKDGVVVMLEWPSISCTARRSAPPDSMCVAKEWRRV